MSKRPILPELDEYEVSGSVVMNKQDKKVMDLTLKELINLVSIHKMTITIELINGSPVVTITPNTETEIDKEFTEEDLDPIIRKSHSSRSSIGKFW